MKIFTIKGVCNVCNKFCQLVGVDKDDGEIMFFHEHMAKFGHWFEGEIKFQEIKTSIKVMPRMPKVDKKMKRK